VRYYHKEPHSQEANTVLIGYAVVWTCKVGWFIFELTEVCGSSGLRELTVREL
jgi:hypothetical protein